MAATGADWAQMEAEYVNGDMSLKALAEKYGLSLSAVQKQSTARRWREKKKKYAERKAEKVSEKLHDREVWQTVRDIERVCRAAGKLIEKANKAIAQLDKAAYVSYDKTEITTEETEDSGVTTVKSEKKRRQRTAQVKTLIDTKRMAEIAKTLQTVKEVLTGEDGRADETENSGVIEIAAATAIDPPPEDTETGASGGDSEK